MPSIGIMELNDLIYEAIWEIDFYLYGETEAALDFQWNPLESIAASYKQNKISKRAARRLFKAALKQAEYAEGTDGLTLEDAVESTDQVFEARDIMHENASSWGCEDRWYILSSCGPAWEEGRSRDVWECLDVNKDVCQNIIVMDRCFVYFVRSDNIVDGASKGESLHIGDKLVDAAHVSLGARGPTENLVPTFGPPIEVMEQIKRGIQFRMQSEGLNLVDIFVEAGVR